MNAMDKTVPDNVTFSTISPTFTMNGVRQRGTYYAVVSAVIPVNSTTPLSLANITLSKTITIIVEGNVGPPYLVRDNQTIADYNIQLKPSNNSKNDASEVFVYTLPKMKDPDGDKFKV